MSYLFRCPLGHQWESTPETTASSGAATVRCPVCGASAVPAASSPAAASSSETLPFVLTDPSTATVSPVLEGTIALMGTSDAPVDMAAQTIVGLAPVAPWPAEPMQPPATAPPSSPGKGKAPAPPAAPAAPDVRPPTEGPAARTASGSTVVDIMAQTLMVSTPAPPSVPDRAPAGPSPAAVVEASLQTLAPPAHPTASFVAAAPGPAAADQTERLSPSAPPRTTTADATAQTFMIPTGGPSAAAAPTKRGPETESSRTEVLGQSGQVRATAELSSPTVDVSAETCAPTGFGPVAAPVSRETVPGYHILGVLGRGGMGVVYKARQEGLNRIVALKTLLSGPHGGEEELARFRIEGEAVARLQHPNIVQVYEVSEQDGRPYLAMEFVDGGGLDRKLDGTPQPPRQAAELMVLLARAMHYAHQCGIIHRDLKPANVLLARCDPQHGVKLGSAVEQPQHYQPKITDFGLAKRLEEDTGQTRTGSIMGTPSYMAPEQAEGKTKQLGPPADIYSLGAVFYDLLTGRPPFRGETVLDTLELVRTVEPLRPSRLQPKVPPDLETVCLKCLEKEPAKRYASAGALAEDLGRFLAGEPIQARPTPAWERAWKWAKRRPKDAALVVVSAAAVLSLAVGGVVFANYERRRADTEAALRGDAEQSAEEARRQERLAQANFERAEKRFKDARDAVDLMLTRVGQERLVREPGLEKVRRDLLTSALQYYERFLQEKSDDPAVRFETARAFERVGDIQEMLGKLAAAEEAYRSAATLLADLVAKQPDRPEYRKTLSQIQNDRAIVLQAAGQPEQAEQAYQDALTLQTKLAADFPDVPDYWRDLGLSYNNRGILLQTRNRMPEAEGAYQQALDLFGKLAAQFSDRPDYELELARAYANLAELRRATGRPQEARDAYQQALDRQARLVARFPDVAEYRKEQGRALLNLGALLHLSGQPQEAEKAYRQAGEVFGELAGKFASVPDYRLLLGDSYNNLGVLLHNRPRDAEPVWRQAVAAFAKLADEFGSEAVYRHKLALSLHELAIVLVAAGKHDEAEKTLGQARDLQEDLVTQVPAEVVYWQKLIITYLNLIDLLGALDRSREVEASYRRFVAALERRASTFPKVPSHKQELATVLKNFGEFLLGRHKLAEALRQLQEAVRYQRAVLDDDPKQPAPRQSLSAIYLSLADTFAQLDDHAEAGRAVAELGQVVPAEWPELPRAAAVLARCVALASQDAKLAEPKRPEVMQAYADRAVELLRRAIGQGYKDVEHLKREPAFEPLRSRQDFQQLLSELEAKGRTGGR